MHYDYLQFKKKKVQIQTNFSLNYDHLFILNVKNFNLPISGGLVTKKKNTFNENLPLKLMLTG